MEVKQPQKYRVRLAFDSYSVGHVIQPTGLWRSSLLSRGFIEPLTEPAEPEPAGMVAGPEEKGQRRSKRNRNPNVVEQSL